jgi:hypothetical protein
VLSPEDTAVVALLHRHGITVERSDTAWAARGALIVYLLEPESDDGLSTWNFFDTRLQKGSRFPVKRIFDLRRRGAVSRRSTTASTQPTPN